VIRKRDEYFKIAIILLMVKAAGKKKKPRGEKKGVP